MPKIANLMPKLKFNQSLGVGSVIDYEPPY